MKVYVGPFWQRLSKCTCGSVISYEASTDCIQSCCMVFFCIVTTNLGITPGALTWDVFVYSVMGIKVQRPRCFFDISINNVLGNTKKTHIAQHLKQVSLTPV